MNSESTCKNVSVVLLKLLKPQVRVLLGITATENLTGTQLLQYLPIQLLASYLYPCTARRTSKTALR